MDYRRYLIYFAATLVGSCCLAAGVNAFIDPYGLFGSKLYQGLNTIKPGAADRDRVVKPHQVVRQRPVTVIGGNSRPEVGLNPDSPCWEDADRPVYNFGIPGASLYMQLRYLDHAIATGRVARIFLGLDLVDFLVGSSGPKNFDRWSPSGREMELRLLDRADGSPNPSYKITQLSDLLTGAFSLEALADSVTTLLAQSHPNSATRRPDGFNPARDYRDIIATEGQGVLFEQKNREVMGRFAGSQGVFQNGDKWSTEWEVLKRFLQKARAAGVKVNLFVNPYHAEYLSDIFLSGKWSLLEDWKRRLVELGDETGAPLWDFNTFDSHSTEAYGKVGDTLKWFWEPAHYRSELGELMLAQMLERDCAAPGQAAFGERLSPSNIEAHLSTLRSGLEAFRSRRPETWSRLEQAALAQGDEQTP